MKRISIISLVIIVSSILLSCNNKLPTKLFEYVVFAEIEEESKNKQTELIRCNENNQSHEIVDHVYYKLCYNEDWEIAEWVIWSIDTNRVKKIENVKRTNDFREDPLILTKSAKPKDYSGTGYDRGHLCPSADNNFSQTAISTSFYMSNMAPQVPKLNRDVWKILEDWERWYAENLKFNNNNNIPDEIIIIAGPVINDMYPILEWIGKSTKIAVPSAFFKILYCEDLNILIGFVFPNDEKMLKQRGNDPFNYVVSIDFIEDITGLDFGFDELLESTVDTKPWE